MLERIRLNRELLNIIIAVQNYKTFQLSNFMLEKCLDENTDYDWYSNVKYYFFAIDRELIEKAGIKQNLLTFEKIVAYQVPKDAETVEYHELSQFLF